MRVPCGCWASVVMVSSCLRRLVCVAILSILSASALVCVAFSDVWIYLYMSYTLRLRVPGYLLSPLADRMRDEASFYSRVAGVDRIVRLRRDKYDGRVVG